jgi:outer membrane lipopolysaccharide assembly protein LptE/RlpB
MVWNKFLLSALCLLVLCSACIKYSFRGALPSYLKTIYIEDFTDRTDYPGLWEEFTDRLNSSFIQDNSLKIIDIKKDADLILSGELMSLQQRPVSFTPQEQVQQFQMVLTVKVDCQNTHTDKPLWGETISRYGIIPGGAGRTEIDEANSVAIDQIVDDIITKTIGAW